MVNYSDNGGAFVKVAQQLAMVHKDEHLHLQNNRCCNAYMEDDVELPTMSNNHGEERIRDFVSKPNI